MSSERPRATFAGLVRASHPGPAVVVTAIAAVLGWAVGLPVGTLVLLIVAIGAGQLSIGWTNDWLDAPDDILAERREKPIVNGAALLTSVRQGAIVAGVVAILTSVLLGIAAGAFALLLTVSGWVYDLGMKKTWASFIPYLVGFAAIPGAATLALPTSNWPQWWAVAMGGLLGVAAHFANTLPDLESDARVPGHRGLPQRFGARWSAVVATLCLVAVAGLGVVGPSLTRSLGTFAFAPGSGENYTGPDLAAVSGPVSLLGLALTLAIAVVVLAMTLAGRRDRWPFRLIMLAALVQVAVLATQGSLLLVPNPVAA